MRRLLLIVLVFLSFSAYGDVSGDLGTFFSNLGYEGNVTAASSYKGQEAGYYSGGSLFLRNRVKNIQLMHIDVPTFRSGCGGIDLFFGGFSFINSQQLTSFFQNIMSSAAGYALNLALETEVPEIAHAMQYIQKIAQEINNSSLNSCEMAEDLVGGLWPKNRSSQQQICQDFGTNSSGAFADWAAARQGCGNGGNFSDQMDKASKDPKYKDRVTVNKNLVWDAINKNGFLVSDYESAELFMSLSGTIIYDVNGKPTVLSPLSNSRDVIKALLNGGSAQIYHCDEPKLCLKPSYPHDISITNDKGLNQQVVAMLNDMVLTVKTDSSLTDKQKGFLNSISIPAFKFITVSLSLNNGAQALDIASYSDVIAKDLLKQYLEEALEIVKQSLVTGTDYTPEIKKQLLDQIQKALEDVENIKTGSHQDIQDATALVNSVRTLEQEATANMSNQMKDNLNFNGGAT